MLVGQLVSTAGLAGVALLSFPHHPDTYAKVINIILSRGLGINMSAQIVRELAFTAFADFTLK
jgi:hypothetical protein